MTIVVLESFITVHWGPVTTKTQFFNIMVPRVYHISGAEERKPADLPTSAQLKSCIEGNC